MTEELFSPDPLTVDRRGSAPEFQALGPVSVVGPLYSDPEHPHTHRMAEPGSLDLGLLVCCGRADCRAQFVVEPKQWQASRPERTRSCPYCFRVGWIPEIPSTR